MNQIEQPLMEVPAGFWRRVFSLIYDLFIIASVELLASALAVLSVVILMNFNLISLNGYLDVSDYLKSNSVAKVIYPAYMLLVFVFFYCYFWHKGGQTIGMRAWRIKIQNSDRTMISWSQALWRLLASLFGLGNLLVLFRSDKKALQDVAARCMVCYYPKK